MIKLLVDAKIKDEQKTLAERQRDSLMRVLDRFFEDQPRSQGSGLLNWLNKMDNNKEKDQQGGGKGGSGSGAAKSSSEPQKTVGWGDEEDKAKDTIVQAKAGPKAVEGKNGNVTETSKKGQNQAQAQKQAQKPNDTKGESQAASDAGKEQKAAKNTATSKPSEQKAGKAAEAPVSSPTVGWENPEVPGQSATENAW